MLVLTQRVASCDTQLQLALPYEFRQKARFRTRLADGEEVGWFLPHDGRPLRGGDCLQAEDGRVVRVLASPESVLHVTAANARELNRVAYHLGNRHVALQVGDGWLRLLDDYVLAEMLQQLGAAVSRQDAPFEPESGAYGGGSHHSHGDAEFHRQPRLHLFGKE
jgi:urease accessory protein